MGNWPGWNFPTTYILNIRCNGRDNTEEQKTFLTQKHHLNNCWTEEKISFSFVLPIQPLVVMRTSYYTCNVIRDVNQWFWICGLKVNLFFDNHVVIITYWLEKMLRKFTFLKYSFFFFEKVLLLSISRNSLQAPSFDDILLGNFVLSNSIIFVEGIIQWKILWNIFDLPPC